jgi:hypothetical protein
MDKSNLLRLIRERLTRNSRIRYEIDHGQTGFLVSVMLVGERPSRVIHTDDDDGLPEPFCSTLGCSGWLNKQLIENEIDESSFFWVNVVSNDLITMEPLQKIVDTIKPKIVIALGNFASKKLAELHIDHIKVFHPQFAKRFRSNEEYQLIKILKESNHEITDKPPNST